MGGGRFLCLLLPVTLEAFVPARRGTAVLGRRRLALSSISMPELQHEAILASSSGAWAGWEVAFSALTGKPQPIDSIYVPEELAEWGQTPMGWELIVWEGTSGKTRRWERQIARILPELGCAADNVAVATSQDFKELKASHVHTWPLERSTVQIVDSKRFPSGETNEDIAAATPFVECRTIFYGLEDQWPGAPLLLARPSKSNTDKEDEPITRKRVIVDFKFDPLVGGIATQAVTVNAMRKLQGPVKGAESTGWQQTVYSAAEQLPMQTRGKATGSARGLGLDSQVAPWPKPWS